MSIVQGYIICMVLFIIWMIFNLLLLAWGGLELVYFLIWFPFGVFALLLAIYLSSRLQPLEVPNDD